MHGEIDHRGDGNADLPRSVAPFDRDDRLALGVAFPAAKSRGEISDPLIRPQAERRQRCRVDQAVVATRTLDDNEIARLQIADPCRIKRNHGDTFAELPTAQADATSAVVGT